MTGKAPYLRLPQRSGVSVASSLSQARPGRAAAVVLTRRGAVAKGAKRTLPEGARSDRECRPGR